MASVSQKPILIAGGGLASLLLAQALRRASIPFHLYERDNSISFRAQGYRLRLSSLGIDAVESVLSPEQFAEFWQKCGKTTGSAPRVIDAITGEEIKEEKSAQEKKNESAEQKPKELLASRDGKIVGIARGVMRQQFLSGCEEYIHWGHNIRGYEISPDGVEAIFADGSKSIKGSMLIGGEGIYSRVAKQLSNGKLKVYDTGARGIHGQAPTSAFKALGEGVWSFRDWSKPNAHVFTITNVRPGEMDDPDVQFGWTMAAQPGVISVPSDDFALIGKPAAEIAQSLTANWHPRVKALFDQMNVEEAAFWKITCSTPSGIPEWKNEPRVTLIGDAVHSMTPAGGLGANTALRDSALLGRLIAEAGGYAEDITAKYEKEMRVYGSETVAISYGQAKSQFGISIEEGVTPHL